MLSSIAISEEEAAVLLEIKVMSECAMGGTHQNAHHHNHLT